MLDSEVRSVGQSTPKVSSDAQTILKVLSSRKRSRRRTDLNRLFLAVQATNKNISETSFLEFFKTLQDKNVGSLIIGRKNNPNRFAWKYSLKDFASGELVPLKPKLVKTRRKAKRGRPVGSRNLARKAIEDIISPDSFEAMQSDKVISVQINLNIPNTKASEVQALIQLAKSLQA